MEISEPLLLSPQSKLRLEISRMGKLHLKWSDPPVISAHNPEEAGNVLHMVPGLSQSLESRA